MGIKKNRKGEISIENFRGRIRLRWRYMGERYAVNLPYAYLPENMHHASIKATEIKLDIVKGCFDRTLEKYNPEPSVMPHPRAEAIAATKNIDNTTAYVADLVKHFNDWGTNIRNIDIGNTTYYLAARSFLEKCRKVPLEQLPQKLNQENWSISTYNERLSLLKSFFLWLVESEIISKNPLKGVCRKRNKRKRKNSRRLPLEENDIIRLLDAIKYNTYCPPASNFKHSYYYPFLMFIFSTGVRNAEAIGLRVKHVDFTNKRVEICEAFARTVKGSNHAARIQKGTKTENSRLLPLADELIELLHKQIYNKQPNDFVFPSPKGKSIDDRMLQRRVLKPVLLKLGLEDRDLYAARHSFGTRAVKQGMPLTDVAYWLGHSTIETAVRNYVTVTPTAAQLPTLNITKPQEL